MMRTFIVMATTNLADDAIFDQYEINPAQILSVRQLPPRRIRVDATSFTTIYSPIVEITMPGVTYYASGVADEILARGRG